MEHSIEVEALEGPEIIFVSSLITERYGLYVALHKGYDEMGSGSDSRYFIYILQ